MALCIAIVDKGNSPLGIFYGNVACDSDNAMKPELEVQYIVHSSLDVVEEKLSHVEGSSRPNELKELYLGILLSTEKYKVYGYVTNTKMKFFLVLELTNTSYKDSELRATFRKLHNAFCDVVSNPFYVPSVPFTSKNFNSVVQSFLTHV